ncbi:glycosyltransferase [Mycobacterium sp. C31M]
MADLRGTVLQIASMVPPARFGGAERVVQSCADKLRETGWQVHNHGLRRRGDRTATGSAIPNIYWPFDGGRRGVFGRTLWHAIDTMTLASATLVDRLIDETEPDVVITHNLRGWGYAPWVVAARRGIPLIHVVHDYGLLCNASTLWHDGASCGRACRARQRNTVKRWPGGDLVGVSHAVLAEHRRLGLAQAGQRVVLHPVGAANPTVPRLRPNVSGAPKVLGYLGRLSAEKGIDTLVEAVSGTNNKLVVAGEGDLAPARLQTTTGQVQWRGWIEPSALFESIDVLVVPSRWREPFGLVVVEAARAGVPVLLADQPGLIEAAEAAGARYLPYPADNVVALRHSLEIPVADYRAAAVGDHPASIVALVESAVGAGRLHRDG